MSLNKYNATTGELENIASGQRTWVGTRAAYDAAKQAGTLPNNAIIAIVDDEQDHNHYSTDEVETGMYWIDGKPIYRKVVDCGNLPNVAAKDVAHGITGIDTVVSIHGMASNSSLNTHFPLPYANTNSTESVVILIIGTNIRIVDAYNFSGYTAKVVLEYTKTTD